jgi:hypothetical protein
VSKEEARRNIINDFDKETAVHLVCGRVDELEAALAELSRRIFLQHANTGLPWLEDWQKICADALRLERMGEDR